jgi:hypothetical protein
MEITLNDTSPKWARSVGSDEADQQSLWEQPAQLKKGSKPEDSQEDSNQKQRVGSRGAAFLRKEQVSERLHHAAHRSPKKEGKPRSPTLSPIVYCRQDSGQELAEVLNACGCCRKALDSKKDIYMYGGEKAFCSVSCRSKTIAREEAEGAMSKRKQGISLPMVPKLW